MMNHALLSPSSAERWLSCPPSARLEATFPDTTSEAAREGSLAHALCERRLRKDFADVIRENITEDNTDYSKDPLYSTEMDEYVNVYANYVNERLEEALGRVKDPAIFVEVKLDLAKYIPEAFGTADCVIIADGILDVIDFKYGRGVPVSAEFNKQLLVYALGAYDLFGFLYSVDTIRLHIVQPRIDNTNSFTIPLTDVLTWSEKILKPGAKKAFDGEGDFHYGNHCTFCRARPVCRELAKAYASIYDELKKPDTLDNREVSNIILQASEIKTWLTEVESYALAKALSGEIYPELKVVEGRSVRRYSDPEEVAKYFIDKGFSEASLYERNVIGITGLEKLVTKKEVSAMPEGFIIKPPGKPTLVPISDKRAEINSTIIDFTEFPN